MSTMRVFGSPPGFVGTPGDDHLDGTAFDDEFDLTQGGNDTARGLDGNDFFQMGDTFNTGDRIRGGAGVDGLDLHGDYNLNFTAKCMTGIDYIMLFPTFDYRLSLVDANVAAGERLRIDAHSLQAADHFFFVGSFETDGAFDVQGGPGDDDILTGAGDDIITGGAGADTIESGAGEDTIDAGTGRDFIAFDGGGFSVNDRIDGGDTDEENILYLNQDLSGGFAFKATTIANITTVLLDGANSYVLNLAHATIRDGSTFAVNDLSGVAANSARVDGHRVDNAYLELTGGAGNDTLIGGTLGGSFNGNGGADVLDTRGGESIFAYAVASDSTGKKYDTIVHFDALNDRIFAPLVDGGVDAVDHKVTQGTLSTATFNGDLAAAIGADELAADHAVLFTPDSGTLAGKLFLIVDGNGVAGYQANDDLVVLLQSAKHMNQFSDTNFDVG